MPKATQLIPAAPEPTNLGAVGPATRAVTGPATATTFITDIISRLRDTVALDAATIGLHGTSVAAVEIMLQTGVLPACRGEKLTEGFVYFVPRKSCFPDHRYCALFDEDRATQRHAELYAEHHGKTHEVAKRYNLNLDHPVDREAADRLAHNDNGPVAKNVIERIATLKLSSSARHTLNRELTNFKGVMIGIDRTALRDLIILEGDFSRCGTQTPRPGTNPDLRIHIPDGLPIRYISTITPLGTGDKKLIEDLKSRHDR